MDDSTVHHAELLVDHCTAVGPGDNVLVKAPVAAEDLVVALFEALGDRGAHPLLSWRNSRAKRAYLRAAEAEEIETKTHELAAMEETDVVVLIKGERNSAESSDVTPEMGAAASQANEPVLKERLDTRWVITQHPTPADAQQAEMSTAGWREYVYDAMLRDWGAQRERQQRVADVLEVGETVRIVVGDRTELELSIEGMSAYNDDATENLPGGEVATSPVVDAATGRVTVDFPTRRRGQVVEDIWLEFEDGEVVDYGAERNEEVLATALETDEGARRLGELGIGMNRGIDEVSHNILFDEKMGGTVHVALGHAMAECVPDGRAFNESSLHMDLLLDTSEEARIEVDGQVIQRNGTFWFEE